MVALYVTSSFPRVLAIVTARKRSCGKVMFSQVFVCPQGGGYLWYQVLSGLNISGRGWYVQGMGMIGRVCPGVGMSMGGYVSEGYVFLCQGGIRPQEWICPKQLKPFWGLSGNEQKLPKFLGKADKATTKVTFNELQIIHNL